MPNALRFRQLKTPKQMGERARLKVVHGPDSGCVFVVTTTQFSVGRGDENDVVIADLRASRRHVEIIRQNSGTWKASDLGSQNGIVWNGKITRSAELRSGDIITVGETAFEFIPEESGTQYLQAPPKSISSAHLSGSSAHVRASAPVFSPHPAGGGVIGLQMPTAGDAGVSGLAGMGSGSGVDAASGDQRKKMIRIVLGLVVAGLLIYEPPKNGPGKNPKKLEAAKKEAEERKKIERELASFLPPLPATGPMAAAETFFQEGFREFREKNYLRARVQFETALQINPGHGLSRSYLQQSERSIQGEVALHLKQGRHDFDSGKLRSARAHFEAVLRLLYRDVDRPEFTEAKDQLAAVLSRMKRGGAES